MSKYPSRTRRNSSVHQAIHTFEQELILKNTWVAGRVIGILEEGFVLQDGSGRIDIIMEVSPSSLPNVGDIIETEILGEKKDIQGKGPVTIFSAQNFLVLVPCQSDFYIRREDPNYLKMVIDLRMKDLLELRSKIISTIRDFFVKKDFLEVETPILVKLPGMEPYLDVFKTQFVGLPFEGQPGKKEEMFLITSPEYAMKKLLVAGHEKIFQITKSFRNKEDESTLHNPEFTMMEWYRAFASYEDIMVDTEELVCSLVKNLTNDHFINFGSHRVDVTTPWERVKVKDLFKKFAHIEYKDFEDLERFRTRLQQQGYKVTAETSYDDMFFMVFLNVIEPNLGMTSPTIVYEYPVQMAALSKPCESDPRYAERFEVYVAGMELANAFTELNDPVEQALRLEHERQERQVLGKDDYSVDQSFIRALEFGMPPSGGIALGVDRLVMLLTGVTDIRDIVYFPQRDL